MDMVEQPDIGPDLSAELKAIRDELAAEKAARKADMEKASRDLLAFASMRQAPAPQAPAGPQPPREIDYDKLPDPDMDRRAYDRALDAERRRFERETRAYEQAQSQQSAGQVDQGKRIYDIVRKQLPEADEEDLRYVAGRVAREVPGDITVYAQHFGDKLATDIVGAYQTKFGKAQPKVDPAPDNTRSESIFGGQVDAPSEPAPGDEPLGSLTGDLTRMQKKAGWSWGA